jgi:PBP1b-binding outer membrane lipoprotein LpoB
MEMKRIVVITVGIAGLAGCSADPYKGRTPAPPDRLQPVAAMAAAPASSETSGTAVTGSVPAGDGSEALAPNYSGYIPRLSGR